MNEYTVKWEVQVDADSPCEAAQEALAIQRDIDSTATVFTVEDDHDQSQCVIDVMEVHEDTPISDLKRIFDLQRELNDKTFAKQQEAKHPYFIRFSAEPVVDHDYSFSDVCSLPWSHPLRQYWIGRFMQACIAEIGEMHETTAWKWWRPIEAIVGTEDSDDERISTTKHNSVTADIERVLPIGMERSQQIEKNRETLQNARVEGIDALHFLVSLLMLLGLDAEGTIDVYTGKHRVNEQRQDSGYTEKLADDTHITPHGEHR